MSQEQAAYVMHWVLRLHAISAVRHAAVFACQRPPSERLRPRRCLPGTSPTPTHSPPSTSFEEQASAVDPIRGRLITLAVAVHHCRQAGHTECVFRGSGRYGMHGASTQLRSKAITAPHSVYLCIRLCKCAQAPFLVLVPTLRPFLTHPQSQSRCGQSGS
jgi:hypothetical protein